MGTVGIAALPARAFHRTVGSVVRHLRRIGPRFSRLAGRLRPIAADDGMSTAEYAVGTIAAVAFAAVLYRVVRSAAVQAALSHIVTTALNVSL